MNVAEIVSLTANLIVIVIPWLLIPLAFTVWLRYRRLKYVRYQWDARLLELHLPSEITRSPRAIEILLANFWQRNSVGGLDQVYFDGRVRFQMSLEIASIEGQIRFFVHCPEKLVDLVKESLYSQYPGIEIDEVEDYLPQVDELLLDKICYGFYWRKKKPAPWPIATYKTYEHDKNPDEEQKIDPLSVLLEYLGGMSYGESASYQFIIRADTKGDWRSGDALPFKEQEDVHDKVAATIKELKESATVEVPRGLNDEGGEQKYSVTNYDPGTPELIKTFRELDDQDTFEMYVRGLYVAEPTAFKGYKIANLGAVIKQFSYSGASAIGTSFETGSSDEEDARARVLGPIAKKLNERKGFKRKRLFVRAYKRRSAFYPPHTGVAPRALWEVFSEEVATLFHLPGSVASTPALKRVDSIKSQPPSNLPF